MSQKKETFEIDGILFDYYDFTLAKMAVSEPILKYELHDKAIQANPKYNGYLHTLERKLEHILENMEPQMMNFNVLLDMGLWENKISF